MNAPQSLMAMRDGGNMFVVKMCMLSMFLSGCTISLVNNASSGSDDKVSNETMATK